MIDEVVDGLPCMRFLRTDHRCLTQRTDEMIGVNILVMGLSTNLAGHFVY